MESLLNNNHRGSHHLKNILKTQTSRRSNDFKNYPLGKRLTDLENELMLARAGQQEQGGAEDRGKGQIESLGWSGTYIVCVYIYITCIYIELLYLKWITN